ncbi:MAG: preprotein translocase subunit SecG [Armatimonadota bacterium]
MEILSKFFSVIQLISAVALIVLVMSQTTKSEGLSGTIGGKMASSFRGKPGLDDKMSYWTKLSAILFGVCSMIVYLFTAKAG